MPNHHHFLIYKPYGYLSQFIYELKRPKKLLGELYNFPEGTMAIGRLDEDSEGLLLFSAQSYKKQRNSSSVLCNWIMILSFSFILFIERVLTDHHNNDDHHDKEKDKKEL